MASDDKSFLDALKPDVTVEGVERSGALNATELLASLAWFETKPPAVPAPGADSAYEHRGVLWVCDKCERIGSRSEARAHRVASGHAIRELDEETSTMIREEWLVTGDPRGSAA